MDYEKAYKEALERAKDSFTYPDYPGFIRADVVFPELAGNNDERIRKELIDAIQGLWDNDALPLPLSVKRKDAWLDWLEKQDVNRTITHEEICKSYGISDIGDFSDGFHTFNGLYHQRMILFAVLVKTYKEKSWKSWKHEDGLDCFGGGWFIVGIDTPAGTYTYHYKAKDWNIFDCQVLEKAKHWDGHDETDVERLFTLVQPIEGKAALEAIKEEKVDNANKNIPKFKAEDWYVNKVDGKIHNFYYSDKDETKFKVGDWVIVNGNENAKQIVRIEYFPSGQPQYIMSNGLWFGNGTEARLWSIADAKPGDVLCYKDEISLFAHDIKNCTEQGTNFGGFVYYCCYDGKRFIVDSLYSLTEQDKIDIHPATKEQRDTLFTKMEEADYKWNAEKKELKKTKAKFKVGDWITNKGHSFLIADIDYEQGRYLFEIGGYTHEQLNWEYIKNADKKYHLWTINDAKDGDVLYSPCCKLLWLYKDEKTCYVGNNLNYHSDSIVVNSPICIPTDARPATKEQRDLLFQKMKEAGYE